MQSARKTQEQLLNRREFTSATVMALLSGVTVTVMGCSSSSPNNPMTPSNPGSGNNRNAEISDNHGHSAAITSAQVSAGQSITLDIRGTGDHPHTVMISMGELTQIAAGQRVSKASSVEQSASTGPHSHTVAFN
jgi:hypothetical protein